MEFQRIELRRIKDNILTTQWTSVERGFDVGDIVKLKNSRGKWIITKMCEEILSGEELKKYWVKGGV